jgi:lipoprotein-releasing system permease protein
LIRGIDPEEEERVIPIRKFLKRGELDLNGDSTVLGIELARKLQIDVGDTLTVYSPGNLSQILDGIKKLETTDKAQEQAAMDQLRDVVLPKELTVTGIYETGHYVHDSEFLLVPVHVGQELYGLGDAVHGLTVKTTDPYGAERVKDSFQRFLTPLEYAQTWIERNSQHFEAIRLERTVMFFPPVLHRDRGGVRNHEHAHHRHRAEDARDRDHEGDRRERLADRLGVPRAGDDRRILRHASGLGMGMLLIRYRNEFSQWLTVDVRHRSLPAAGLSILADPAEVVPNDVAIICIGAFVICSLAALIPAYFAARLDPVKALRFE